VAQLADKMILSSATLVLTKALKYPPRLMRVHKSFEDLLGPFGYDLVFGL